MGKPDTDVPPRRILAFDCSGASCSAAVLEGGRILATRFAAMERGQAEALMPMIAETMAESGLDFAALDLIATTVGPGSFTGIRIGLAAGQGLALAAGKPLHGVTAFAAHRAGLAPERRAGRPVAIVIDSRRGPVFLQCFRADGGVLAPPRQVEPADLPGLLPAGPIVLAGDGLPLAAGIVSSAARDMAPPAPPDRIRAESVALLAAGLDDSASDLSPLPLYLRAPDVTMPTRR